MRASVVRTLLVGFLAFCLGLASTGIANAAPKDINGQSNGVSAEKVHGALAGVPGVLEASKGSKAKAKGQSVVLENEDGVVVDVPLDAKKGVKLGQGDKALTVKLPNGDMAGKGQLVSDGTVAYSSEGSSANAVQLLDEGNFQSVRMLTVIGDKTAPTEYSYDFSVPAGMKLEETLNGGAVILNKDNKEVAGVISPPWATDANGVDVPTRYEVRGHELVQVVDHVGSAYPVTADPRYTWYSSGVIIWLSRTETRVLSYGTAGAVGTLPYIGWATGAWLGYQAAAADSRGLCLAYWFHYWWGITDGWWYRC